MKNRRGAVLGLLYPSLQKVVDNLVQHYIRTSHRGERLVTLLIPVRIATLYMMVIYYGTRIADPHSVLSPNLVRLCVLAYFFYVLGNCLLRLSHPQILYSSGGKTCQVAIDVAFASSLLLVSRDPASDMYILYLFPIVLAADYLDSQYFSLSASAIVAIFVATTWAMGVAPAPDAVAPRLNILVFRALVLLGSGSAYWLLRRLASVETLDLTRAHLSHAVRSLNPEICIINEDHVVMWISPRLRVRHGPVEPGMTCQRYITGSSEPCLSCPLETSEQDKYVRPLPTKTIGRGLKGQEYEYECVLCAERLDESKAVLSIRDVTAWKALDRELGEYAAKIDDLANAKTRVLSDRVQGMSANLASILEAAILSTLIEQGEDDILYAILAKFARPMNCGTVILRTLATGDGETPGLLLRAAYGLPEGRSGEVMFLPVSTQSLVLDAYRSGQVVMSLDVQNKAHKTIHHADLASQDGLHSMACFPLIAKGKSVGTCTFYRNTISAFTEEDVALGEAGASLLSVTLENMRLYHVQKERTQERQAWLDFLHELTVSAAQQGPIQPVLVHATELTRKYLRAETAAIFLLDKGKLRRRTIAGLSASWFEDESYSPGEGITGAIIVPYGNTKYGMPRIVDEAHKCPEVIHSNLQRYEDALPSGKVKHIIAVPMNGQEGSFGVLRLMNRVEDHSLAPQGFRQEDVELLVIAASQIATFIENSELFLKEKTRRRLAERLAQASVAVSSSLEIGLVLGQILDQLSDVVPYDFARILIPQVGGVRTVAARGFDQDDGDGELVIPLRSDFPTTSAMECKESVIVGDLLASCTQFASFYTQGLVARSWMGVPMKRDRTTIGLITLASRQPNTYTSLHSENLRLFGVQAAIALTNAGLYADAQHSAQCSSRMVDIAQQLNKIVEIPALIDIATSAALDLVKSAQGSILHRYDPSTCQLAPVHAYPSYNTSTGRLPVSLDSKTIERAVEKRHTIYVSDDDSEPTSQGSYSRQPRSLIVAPLYAGAEKILGTLSVYSDRLAAFRDIDGEYLTMLASITAASWANIELWRAREERRKQMEGLVRDTREYSVDIGLGELCRLIANTACKTLEWESAAVKLLSPDQSGIEVYAVPQENQTNSALTRTPIFSVERLRHSMEGSVAVGGCYWVRGAHRHSQDGVTESANRVRLGEDRPRQWTPDDSLVVPLVSSKWGQLGWLAVCDPHRRLFPSKDTLQMLEVLGGHASVALARAILYEHVSTQRDRLHSYLSLLGPQLGSFTETDKLADFVVGAVVRLLGVQACVLWTVSTAGEVHCLAYAGSCLDGSVVEYGNIVSCIVAAREIDRYREVEDSKLRLHGSCQIQNQLPSHSPIRWTLVPMVNQANSIVGVIQLGADIGSSSSVDLLGTNYSFLEALGRQVAADVERIQERKEIARGERNRLESELHEAMDVLNSGVCWEAERTHQSLGLGQTEDVLYGLKRIEMLSKRVYQDLRYILRDLGNPILEDQGLVPALEDYANTVGSKRVTVRAEPLIPMPLKTEHALYRIAQEAISNALKHASSPQNQEPEIGVDISVTPDQLVLRVSDAGCGFELDRVRRERVLSGLRRMEEWASQSDVLLTVESQPGEGTHVIASVRICGDQG